MLSLEISTKGVCIMANLIDYLTWRGDLSIERVPFCDIDGLILSQMSYTRMHGVVTESFLGQHVTVEEMAEVTLEEEQRLKQEEDEGLWRRLKESSRFKELELVGYVDRFDAASEKQFAAVTVLLPDNKAVIVYRGTDLTIVGWKEDFNMSFSDCVPAQIDAVEYIESAAKDLPDYDFYVCGHSKGGNLAVYASAFCDKDVQKRILAVRNFDGPGFSEGNIAKDGMKRILPKTKTYLPQSSVVGMLLEHEEEFTVIYSRSLGVLQHDLYTWDVMGPTFIIEEETTGSSQFIDQALKEWLKVMPKDKREAFVETVFSILDDCDAVTLRELFSGKNAARVVKNLTQMEEEERALVQKGLGILLNSMKRSIPLKLKKETE